MSEDIGDEGPALDRLTLTYLIEDLLALAAVTAPQAYAERLEAAVDDLEGVDLMDLAPAHRPLERLAQQRRVATLRRMLPSAPRLRRLG